MIAVRVRDDDVFDGCRIEAELFQAADDGVFGGVFVERVDQDDAVARGQRPGGMNLGADEIEIVEDFRGLGDPGVARGQGPDGIYPARSRRDADARGVPGNQPGAALAAAR
jgi:hypothetical protein